MTPKPTGARAEVHLWGKLIPWGVDGQPVLLWMPDGGAFYVPLFSERRQLHSFMVRVGASYASVKEITDPREFLRSIPTTIVLAIDPKFTPEGKARWLEVQR